MQAFTNLLFLSIKSKQKVLPITYSRFIKLVLGRQNGTVWAILFHNPNRKNSDEIKKQFSSSVSYAEGAIHFGIVDASKQAEILDNLSISLGECPKVMVFHTHGATDYVGKIDPQLIIPFFYKFIPDYSIKVDNSWKKAPSSISEAILFSNESTSPPFWRAISQHFSNDDIKIGFSNDEKIMDLFDIGDLPVIMLYNSSLSYADKEKMSFGPVKKMLLRFLHRKLQPKKQNPEESFFYYSEEFIDTCLKGRTLCVAYAVDDIDQKYEHIMKSHLNLNAKWFYGKKDWGVDEIQPNSIWVFNPKQHQRVAIKNLDHLDKILAKPSQIPWKTNSKNTESDL